MMKLFSGKRWASAVAFGGVLAAGLAVAPSARAADDLPVVGDIHIPMPRVLEDDSLPPPAPGYERPGYGPYAERPYRPGPYGQGPYAAIPPSYGRPAPDARPMLPPSQVVAVLRSSGYSPLGRITQRGWIYTVAALDPNGDDGRLIIDARTGRIMRFVPAMEVDATLNDRMARAYESMAYGPPVPPAPVGRPAYDARPAPSSRPPAAAAQTAKRPSPKIASRMPQSAPAAVPARQPATASGGTAAENKAARVTVGAASASAAPATPAPPSSDVKLWPTQKMPDVQPLE